MNLWQILHLFCVIIYIYSAGFVLSKNPGSLLNRICSFLIISFVFWSFGKIVVHNPAVSEASAAFFENIASLGWSTFSSIFLLFALVFTEKIKKLHFKLFYVPLVIIPLFFIYKQWTNNLLRHVMHSYGWGNLWVESIWPYLYFLFYFICMITGLYLIFSFSRKTDNAFKKQQAKIIFYLTFITFIAGSFSDVIFPKMKIISIPEIADVFCTLWVIGLVYVVIKYKFLTITPATAAENILSTMSDGLFLLNNNGIIKKVNESVLKMTGYTFKELNGTRFIDYLGSEQKSLDSTQKKVFLEKEVNNYDVIFQAKDSRNIPILLSTSRLKDETGTVVGIVCVAKDITEKKKMEEDILKVQKLESIGILASGIAHDFNNVLNTMLGNISLAKKLSEPGSKIYQRLQKAEQISFHAKQLTQQLITFSKGGIPVMRLGDVSMIIKETVDLALSGSNIESTLLVADDLWFAEFDSSQIRQLINNLISNAREALSEGGSILVRAGNILLEKENTLLLPEGNYIKIEIQDTGKGIPKERLSKIFDPYFTTKTGGSGLGLAICYSIVKKHNGTIDVQSESSVGSTFTVYLPASEKKIISKKVTIEKDVKGEGRILLMDDDEDFREVAQEMLKNLGYEVSDAKDGRESVAAYKKALEENRPYRVVIMDLIVPGGMGGKDAIERLLEIDPDAKVIVCSGYSNDPVMAHYKDYGFKEILRKPFAIEELDDVLSNVISKDD